ncbi:MAG: AAA family ATPase [Candidatus Marinimicrobia bacterium]|nr:AAA family ATPase [Candidatus Neomarinimicrobiota bacterium]
MEYYEIIGLNKEPFSMAPEPEFFYHSKSHGECLDRLEISLRLNRGLNVVIGGIGTGKTMLSRLLLGRFVEFGQNHKFHLILDPTWDSSREFLQYLSKMFGLEGNVSQHSEMMDQIEHYLIDSSIHSKRNNVLIIDEGQKMGPNQLEIIRMLLNFETNDTKLIQVIIFAQHEIKELLDKHENFKDRIAFGYEIKPLDLEDTAGFITHRMEVAGLLKGEAIFSKKAIEVIHDETKGYPRKIVRMCHQMIIEMILNKREKISSDDVFELKKSSNPFYV